MVPVLVELLHQRLLRLNTPHATRTPRPAGATKTSGPARTSGTATAVPSMHADAVVDLPPGAIWLGASDMYPYQAFRVGSAWGVQFHPEASRATIRTWAGSHDELDVTAVEAGYVALEAEVAAAGRAVAAGFAAVCQSGSGTRSSASTIVYA